MPKTFTFNGVAGLNRALGKLPKTAQVELRDASVKIAATEAQRAGTKARARGGLAALVAPSIRATRDRVPKVLMGSAKKLPPRDGKSRTGASQTIGNVIWGAEFGGQRRPTTQQFAPWRGSGDQAGYFLWPTIREDQSDILNAYGDALMQAVDGAAKGAH